MRIQPPATPREVYADEEQEAVERGKKSRNASPIERGESDPLDEQELSYQQSRERKKQLDAQSTGIDQATSEPEGVHEVADQQRQDRQTAPTVQVLDTLARLSRSLLVRQVRAHRPCHRALIRSVLHRGRRRATADDCRPGKFNARLDLRLAQPDLQLSPHVDGHAGPADHSTISCSSQATEPGSSATSALVSMPNTALGRVDSARSNADRVKAFRNSLEFTAHRRYALVW